MKNLIRIFYVSIFTLTLTACDGGIQEKETTCLPHDEYRRALLKCHSISDKEERRACGKELDGVTDCDAGKYMKLK